MQKRLFISISHHGFGHIGQMAPVLNLLMEGYPELKITIQCAMDKSLLSQWFHFPFTHRQDTSDIGMLMTNALDVQAQQSHRAYKELHSHWAKQLVLKSREIARSKADLVISNVSYVTLAGAHEARVPSIGLCSLNWADIYEAYCGALPQSEGVLRTIRKAYSRAEKFLIPTPGMPMRSLPNREFIGPIARIGNKSDEVRARWGLEDTDKLVLISLGGTNFKIPFEKWPRLDSVKWIVPDTGFADRDDCISFRQLNTPFIDVLANCDAAITKPGYGMFTESACNQIPVLYCPRADWPEEPCLVNWIGHNGQAQPVSREALMAGDVVTQLDRVWSMPSKPKVPVSGVEEAVGHIIGMLE